MVVDEDEVRRHWDRNDWGSEARCSAEQLSSGEFVHQVVARIVGLMKRWNFNPREGCLLGAAESDGKVPVGS